MINPQTFKIIPIDQDLTKITFKDKVVQVFLSQHNAEADLKTIVDQFILRFEDDPLAINL